MLLETAMITTHQKKKKEPTKNGILNSICLQVDNQCIVDFFFDEVIVHIITDTNPQSTWQSKYVCGRKMMKKDRLQNLIIRAKNILQFGLTETTR
jgi:hypothetical protein